MLERDWSKPLGLGLVEEPVKQLPLMYRHFSGKAVRTMDDHNRLEKQFVAIMRVMMDGKWRTVHEIHQLTSFLHTSISAQLRNLRKIGFGSHTVKSNERAPDLYEFQVILNQKDPTAARLLKEQENANRKYFHAKHPKPFDLFLDSDAEPEHP